MELNKLFIERHTSKEGYLNYMKSVILDEELHGMLLVPDALSFHDWLLQNVLKSANTFSCIKLTGKENWINVIIDNVPLNKKRGMLSVLEKYGFKRTTLKRDEELAKCEEVWHWVPCPSFKPNAKGKEGNLKQISDKYGSTDSRQPIKPKNSK